MTFVILGEGGRVKNFQNVIFFKVVFKILFGSARSPRCQDIVCPSERYLIQKNIEKEF